MKLYELATALALIQDQLDQTGGELTVALEAELDHVQLAFVEKVEHVGRWIGNLNARETILEQEIARLKHKKDVTANLRDRLKEYVKSNMLLGDVKKLEYDFFTVRVQKNPPSLLITDQSKIPAAFLTVIPESYEPNRKKIMEAYKDTGELVSGTEVVTDKSHLRIE